MDLLEIFGLALSFFILFNMGMLTEHYINKRRKRRLVSKCATCGTETNPDKPLVYFVKPDKYFCLDCFYEAFDKVYGFRKYYEKAVGF